MSGEDVNLEIWREAEREPRLFYLIQKPQNHSQAFRVIPVDPRALYKSRLSSI